MIAETPPCFRARANWRSWPGRTPAYVLNRTRGHAHPRVSRTEGAHETLGSHRPSRANAGRVGSVEHLPLQELFANERVERPEPDACWRALSGARRLPAGQSRSDPHRRGDRAAARRRTPRRRSRHPSAVVRRRRRSPARVHLRCSSPSGLIRPATASVPPTPWPPTHGIWTSQRPRALRRSVSSGGSRTSKSMLR